MTNLLSDQQIGLLLELLEALCLPELLPRPRLGHLLDGPGVVSPQLLLDRGSSLLGDGLLRLAVLVLVVEEPIRQPVPVPKGVLVVPFVDEVVGRLFAEG